MVDQNVKFENDFEATDEAAAAASQENEILEPAANANVSEADVVAAQVIARIDRRSLQRHFCARAQQIDAIDGHGAQQPDLHDTGDDEQPKP